MDKENKDLKNDFKVKDNEMDNKNINFKGELEDLQKNMDAE